MRETFNLSREQASKRPRPPLSLSLFPLRQARFFHLAFLLLFSLSLLLLLFTPCLPARSHAVFASASQRNLFAILKCPESPARAVEFSEQKRSPSPLPLSLSLLSLDTALGSVPFPIFLPPHPPKFISRRSLPVSLRPVSRRAPRPGVFISATFLTSSRRGGRVDVTAKRANFPAAACRASGLYLYRGKGKYKY